MASIPERKRKVRIIYCWSNRTSAYSDPLGQEEVSSRKHGWARREVPRYLQMESLRDIRSAAAGGPLGRVGSCIEDAVVEAQRAAARACRGAAELGGRRAALKGDDDGNVPSGHAIGSGLYRYDQQPNRR